ncbi:MAG TPA: hypothetical protein VNX68_02385 [Nitrosopumilaceae archaeon]|jgi:hypothetical protein|nr:hypothetical protein [Nitrosopumilaceae archaeon]
MNPSFTNIKKTITLLLIAFSVVRCYSQIPDGWINGAGTDVSVLGIGSFYERIKVHSKNQQTSFRLRGEYEAGALYLENSWKPYLAPTYVKFKAIRLDIGATNYWGGGKRKNFLFGLGCYFGSLPYVNLYKLLPGSNTAYVKDNNPYNTFVSFHFGINVEIQQQIRLNSHNYIALGLRALFENSQVWQHYSGDLVNLYVSYKFWRKDKNTGTKQEK